MASTSTRKLMKKSNIFSLYNNLLFFFKIRKSIQVIYKGTQYKVWLFWLIGFGDEGFYFSLSTSSTSYTMFPKLVDIDKTKMTLN